MSYDIYLEIDTGGSEKAVVWERNMTSNVAPMWRRAMPDTDGLAGLHDKTAADALPLLEAGLAYTGLSSRSSAACASMNGWGDYDSAREYVAELLGACRTHPATSIYVSR